MKLRAAAIAFSLVLFLAANVFAGTWIIKQDVLQPFSEEKCAYETVLRNANADEILGGGRESVSNAFGTPNWIISGEGSSTRVTWTGSRVIEANASGRHSFGVTGNGPMPQIADTYWTGCPRQLTGYDIVPGVSIDRISDPVSGVAYVTISNTTNEAIKVNNIHYLNRRFVDLTDLNHGVIPLGNFSRVDIDPDMQLLLGESFTFPVRNSRRTDFLIMKFDVEYAVSSAAENDYKGTTEEWFAYRQLDANPGSIHSYDVDDNLQIDDHEFFKALDDWIAGAISDSLFFDVTDLWVAQGAIAVRGFGRSSRALEANLALTSLGARVTVENISTSSLELEVFSLDGERVFAQSAPGSSLSWNLRADDGRELANGIYFYVLSAVDADGKITRSAIKKFALIR